MLTCVYMKHWKPEDRGRPCGARIETGAGVPLCAEHAKLKCEICGSPAIRRYLGKELCQKKACADAVLGGDS